MKRTSMIALTAACAVALLGVGQEAQAFQKKSTKKPVKSSSSKSYSGPETGLAGIKLYDSGLRVLAMYGNPDSIAAVSVASTADAGGGSQGGPPGGFGGPPPSGGGNGKGMSGGDLGVPGQLSFPGMALPSDVLGTDNLWQPVDARQQNPGTRLPPKGAPGGNPTGSTPVGGPPPSGAPGGAPSGAPGGGGNTATESTVFTRWTYTKNGTKLAFVIDKFNRVLQIEAIGLQNAKISTKRGVGFGSTFSTVMNRYSPSNDPDGYDLAGNNFTIRFLTRTRVAFRLTQLASKKAHVVTGIVVSAGKK